MASEPIYELDTTAVFRKELKRAKKRGLDLRLLQNVVDKLQCGEQLPESNRDHALTGDFRNYRECHIQPDWLLVYRIIEKELVLLLVRTGTHSDLDF